MIGTVANALAILVFGIVGLRSNWSPAARYQGYLKIGLAALTAFIGLATALTSLHGSWSQIFKGIVIGLLALILGNLLGKLLGLQRSLNRLGKMARERLASPAGTSRIKDGLVTATIAFCGSPMALLGALLEGLGVGSRLLLTKSALDGLATLAFVRKFGGSPMLGIVPLVALQGLVSLGAARVEPFLRDHALDDSVTFVAGFLVSFLSLVILDIKKVPTADYLPSLVLAPLLAWVWR